VRERERGERKLALEKRYPSKTQRSSGRPPKPTASNGKKWVSELPERGLQGKTLSLAEQHS